MNSDAIMIANVNLDTLVVTLLSIPRDTPVYIPGVGVSKVNTAYARGGPDLFKRTILYNFGLSIDHYVAINFEAVVKAVDALGGVDVIVSCPLKQVFPRDPYYIGGPVVSKDYTDRFTGEVWRAGTLVPTLTIDIPKAGVYSMDGLRALAFVRARFGIPGGDVDRGRREQRLVRAMLAKVRQIGTTSAIIRLYRDVREHVETDLSLETLLRFGLLAMRLGDTTVRSFHLAGEDFNGAALNGSEPLRRVSWTRFIEQALKVSTLRIDLGIPIVVLNGTNDAGFALAAADRLKELGFVVQDLRPAERPYTRTLILDHSPNAKGSPVNLLLRTFQLSPSQVRQQPSNGKAQLTIIIGDDFNPCYYDRTREDKTNLSRLASSFVDKTDPSPKSSVVISTSIETKPLEAILSEPSVILTATKMLADTAIASPPLSATQTVSFTVPRSVVVNARSAPTARARVLARLTAPFTAEIKGRSVDGKWLQFMLPQIQQVAWVSLDTVSIVTDTTAATLSQTSPDLALHALLRRGRVVNLRREPSLRSEVLTVLRGERRLEVIATDPSLQWLQVRADGQIGWVNRKLVQLIGRESKVPVVGLP